MIYVWPVNYHGHPPSTDHTHTQRKISPPSSSTAVNKSFIFLVHFMGGCTSVVTLLPYHWSGWEHHTCPLLSFLGSKSFSSRRNNNKCIHSVTATNPGSQQHQQIRSIAVNTENANTAMNSREYRPHWHRTSLSSSHHNSLNLHAVWDDSIIKTILRRDFQDSRNAFEVYIHDIRTNPPSTYNDVWLHWSDATNLQCVSTWGEASFDLAMQYTYANVDGSEIVDGETLDERYYLTRNPTVRTQLAIASVRLAVNLQQIFE